MRIEELIEQRMESCNVTRLEAIASLDLGKRSLAASRVLERRHRRKELMSFGLDFRTACIATSGRFDTSH